MDETYSLTQTVETILKTCRREDIAEIIIILCDRSSEDCRSTAEELVKKYEGTVSIYIMWQTLPFVGGAIRDGIDKACGSHVIMMSSDLETDPDVVHRFINASKKYPDRIITASRWREGGGFEKYSRIKLVCNLIFERAIGLFYLTRLSDLTYAFRIFPSRLMKAIDWEELKHPFFLETALKPLRLGTKFVEIPGHWAARTEGVSQNGFFANFKYFRTAWHNRFLTAQQILRKDNG